MQAIQYHYDVSNEFYQLWLDEKMVYSCAYFKDPAESIDAAQSRKLDYICRKLRLEPGDRLLDIGCGWGALIMHATRALRRRGAGHHTEREAVGAGEGAHRSGRLIGPLPRGAAGLSQCR